MASSSDPKLRGDLPWLLLAATGGLAMAIGSPPGGITLAIWLGFVPLQIVAHRLRARRARRRFFAGWIGGLGIGLVGFPWIGALLERFAGLPTPVAWLGLFVFAAWTAIPFGLWMVTSALAPPPGTGRGVWPWVWPAVSWIGLSTMWPALFPYTPMIGIAEVPEWMQAAELLGVAGVEAQIVTVGVALALAVRTEDRRRRFGLGALAVAIPVVSWVLGSWRIAALDRQAEDARVVRFGIVQPNTPLFATSAAEKMARLWVMSRDAQDDGAQVIVWPEAGSFPQRTIRPFERDFTDPSRRVLRVHQTPTIFGAASIEPGDRWEYNTVYAMSATGEVTGAFDKVVLVPLGEYVPVLDPDWVRSKIPAVSHNHAGEGPARFEVEPRGATGPEPAIHLGPVVCYEDIFIDFAHSVAVQEGGIDAFVNVTIDTWFGATAEPWEHLALAQFRSVEHRVPMVRSVAAGPASVVDHAGRLVATLPVRDPLPRSPVEPEYLVADVKLPRNTAESPTVFARFGWTFRWWCAAAVLGVVAWSGTQRMRRRGAA